MELNGTFFVQIIHFAIVYYVLRKFLFRPIVDIIMQERAYAQSLHASIEQQNQIIEHMQSDKHEQWQEYTKVFAEQAPSLDSAVDKSCCDFEQPVEKMPVIHEQELKATQSDLLKRIDHVVK